MTNELNTISVVLGPANTRAEVPEEATLGPRNLVRHLTGPVEISVDTLRASLKKLTENLSTLLADLKAVGGFTLRVSLKILPGYGRSNVRESLTRSKSS